VSKLSLFFPLFPFYDFHLNKDVGLFVKYLSKYYFSEAEILKAGNLYDKGYETPFFTVKNLFLCPRIYKENWAPLSFQFQCILKSFLYLKRNRNITHVMLFHITHYSVYFSLLIKLFLPHIKIYIKCDTAIDGAEAVNVSLNKKISFGQIIKKWIFPHIDLVSVETFAPYKLLQSNPWLRNIKLIPNGLDDDLFEIDPDSLPLKKTDTIITVGRIGSYQKNTELLLDLIKEIDLGDWQLVCIGPIECREKNFQNTIDEFHEKHPDLKSKVIFTGNIADPLCLFEYYKKSKIFVFPSRFESFGIALIEAAAFGNYIISTDVGASRDITDNGRYGYICPDSIEFKQNEKIIKNSIKQHLSDIINGIIKIDKQIIDQAVFVKQNFLMSTIIKNPALLEWSKPKGRYKK
jgi:glycosyltransferase involved in cell wall biosynthesis